MTSPYGTLHLVAKNGEVVTSWHSYPSIYNLGHKAIDKLLDRPVLVEEKVDGSQFSFGYFPDAEPGLELKVKSKGAIIHVDAPPAMFRKAVETVKRIATEVGLRSGWTYRGEVLANPHHNTLAYDRAPTGNIIIFDINTGEEAYLDYDSKAEEAKRLGLEVVPLVFRGIVPSIEAFRELIDKPSILGGQKMEGVVIKPEDYLYFGLDKKVLMGKFVSEKFREVHGASWRAANPTTGDIIQVLGERYRTPARWNKAIQHLDEAGKLEYSVRDIGKLIGEIGPDIERECKDEIMEDLYAYARKHLIRHWTRGFPEHYKELLLERQFEKYQEPPDIAPPGVEVFEQFPEEPKS